MQLGRNTLVINVKDTGNGLFDSAVFIKAGTLGTAEPANTAPRVKTPIIDQIIPETRDSNFDVSPNFQEPDAGDRLTWSAKLADGSNLPGWITLDQETGTFKATPTSNDVGTITIKVTATDNSGATAMDSFDVSVAKVINGTVGRDTLLGTIHSDIITGDQGADIIEPGGGRDIIVYNSIIDAGDVIKGFKPGEDILDLGGVLESVGFQGSDPITEGYLRLVSSGTSGTVLQLDADGNGSAPFRPYLFLQGVSATDMLGNPNSLVFI